MIATIRSEAYTKAKERPSIQYEVLRNATHTHEKKWLMKIYLLLLSHIFLYNFFVVCNTQSLSSATVGPARMKSARSDPRRKARSLKEKKRRQEEVVYASAFAHTHLVSLRVCIYIDVFLSMVYCFIYIFLHNFSAINGAARTVNKQTKQERMRQIQ